MSAFTRPDHLRYTAQIGNVREVTLHGTADLAFWRTFLQPYQLLPDSSGGAAQLVLSATALVWQGLAFRELIVTIATCTDRKQPQHDSFYLAHAFNSSRFLSWSERRFFQTPYTHTDVYINTSQPEMELWHHNRLLFKAQMVQHQEPTARRCEDWNGPVFLPAHGSAETIGKHFFVALSGEQAICPFVAGTDLVEIAPDGDQPVFQWLRESRFTPTEWRIRASATHARSKTYHRKFAPQS